MTQCVFLNLEQFKAREQERREAIDAFRKANGVPDGEWPPALSTLNAAYFPPGTMWFCPWYHDPAAEGAQAKVEEMLARMAGHETQHPRHAEGYRWHLSIHYWRDHALRRPPIEVVCPGGGHWCPDQISTNGSGWTVTGEAPNITCSPSIWVSQGEGPPREYHGFLQGGVFTPPV